VFFNKSAGIRRDRYLHCRRLDHLLMMCRRVSRRFLENVVRRPLCDQFEMAAFRLKRAREISGHVIMTGSLRELDQKFSAGIIRELNRQHCV